ncbi:TadE/TadG family type IV pilus assembly protein [Kitasatospora sp. LaBMicrA B282]|uniref:TadE/TadG family type IV pilus assembly protein n=1 Tax=Kitasatospora sp. LaBMicrA B282 TaxID=3420949 RepID=UPI003D147480
MVFPVIVLLILLVVQVGLLWYSESLALAAAREGADAGRSYTGGDDAARQRAAGFLSPYRGLLGTPQVALSHPDARTISVTVQFTPLYVLPGLDRWTVARTVQEPMERVVGP